MGTNLELIESKSISEGNMNYIIGDSFDEATIDIIGDAKESKVIQMSIISWALCPYL